MEIGGSLTLWAQEIHSPDARLREEAARQIWLRFAERLRAVVVRRLDPRLLRRTDPDDVLQSLFAHFFAAAPGPNGTPRNRVELWRLLVHFTMCQVAHTAEHHRAQRRDVRRERSLASLQACDTGTGAGWVEPADTDLLGPETETIVREEFARLLAVLPEDLQRVFLLRLEGHTNAEIATKIERSERMVELKLRTIRGLLRPYLDLTSKDTSSSGSRQSTSKATYE